ncbi:MAG: FliM/FliN family flagellar motor switch protein, partial [Chloroflexota bacterium]
ELEKLAGEPGDVYINGTMVGRGEIVVVDDRFGIRVFDVVDPRSANRR